MQTSDFNSILENDVEFLKMSAFGLTRDKDAAKDLMQETLYRALANQSRFKHGTNIKAWLHTIMRNIFINDYRRKKNRRTIFDNTTNEFLLNHMQSAVPNVAEANIGLKSIRSEIYKLPDIFKYPFEMFIDGYKYHEIAFTLKEPLGTIKSRIHFARKILKEEVAGY